MKRFLKPLLIILAILILTLSVSASDLFGTYDHRIKVTIDHTDIDSDLSWFPVTVFLTSSQGAEVFTEFDADEDFDRIAFTSSDGETQLYADCELFDVSENKAIYHVSKTGWTVSSSADTDIYLYYDNTAGHNTTYISKSGGTAGESVWDTNYKAVYHMNDHETFTDWDTEYDGSTLPTASTPAWNVTVDDGASEGDYASVSGGILTIDTTVNNNGTDQCYYNRTPDVDFDAGVYVKFRLQMHSDSGTYGFFMVQLFDGTQNEGCYAYVSKTGFYYYDGITHTLKIFDTITAYHNYEIYIKGTTIYFYVDGEYLGTQTVQSGTYTDGVFFGNSNIVHQFKGMLDYLNYALDIGYNPTADILDATSNHNDGTKKGSNEPIEATGKVGQGQDFDGSDDYINVGNSGLDPGENDFTIETVFSRQAYGSSHRLFNKRPSTLSQWIDITLHADNTIETTISQNYGVLGAVYQKTSTTFTTDDWNYHAASFDRDGNLQNYVNGSADGSAADISAHSADLSPNYNAYIGSYRGIDNVMNGIIDEQRISFSLRSDAWIAATYASLWDNLLTYGSEETAPTGETTNVLFIFSNF